MNKLCIKLSILFLGLINFINSSMCASAIGTALLRGRNSSLCIADSSKRWKCLKPCPDHPGNTIFTIRETDGKIAHNHTSDPQTWYDVRGHSTR